MALKSKNPFYDSDDDMTDEAFLNYRNPNRVVEERYGQLLEERRQIENRTVQSSKTAVRTIFETEQIGIEAAEELNRQGEQLRKVDRNLDEINGTMRTTQKHLTAMKSMFSGFKSYFGRSNTVDGSSSGQTATSPEDKSSQSKLAGVVSQVRGESEKARVKNHPALRHKGIVDTSGFAATFSDDEDDDDEDNRVLKTARGPPTGGVATPSSRSQLIEQEVDNDLAEIGQGLSRLKSLAHGFSSELDDQLSLLNNINTKADQAEGSIAFQNNQMNRLLKR